ncbi:ECF transporter S component [Candidatus Hecatella orcuttiae]|uniref:ECF transporter S component n=1 Tax=Candidatus Hecatella orcuttiae TaxID=1935119 RepID=UPI002867E002|nr:ECF transporter S component [Candidatus Hecatella orcuttiae]
MSKRYSKSKTLHVARWGIFSALSVVGSLIPFPSPVGTIAFDSFPGYFAALYFGVMDGAVIFAIGHLATSIVHGFPLGFWHFLIALGMAVVGVVVGIVHKVISRVWGFIPATIAGITANTAMFPLAVPVMGWAGSLLLVPFLAVASTLNGILAMFIFIAIRRRKILVEG